MTTSASTFRYWALQLADCNESFLDFVSRKIARVESFIDELLNKEEPFIRDSGRYIIKSGGKRLRPLLLIISGQLTQYQGEDDIYLGTILEYIHTATLVHDDIIDNSQQRRGRHSANFVWGNHTAVLLGDYFYTTAMALAINYGNMKILRILTHITTQMLKGEILGQIHDNNIWMTEQDIYEIMKKKTACLFSSCCQIAAILNQLSPDLEQTLADFGMNLGIAFQIIDDLLDYTSTAQEMGKPALHDLLEGKITLPFFYLMRKASVEELKPIIEALQASPPRTPDLEYVSFLINKYSIPDIVYDKAQSFASRALHLLQKFPESDARRLLQGLVQFIIQRRS